MRNEWTPLDSIHFFMIAYTFYRNKAFSFLNEMNVLRPAGVFPFKTAAFCSKRRMTLIQKNLSVLFTYSHNNVK